MFVGISVHSVYALRVDPLPLAAVPQALTPRFLPGRAGRRHCILELDRFVLCLVSVVQDSGCVHYGIGCIVLCASAGRARAHKSRPLGRGVGHSPPVIISSRAGSHHSTTHARRSGAAAAAASTARPRARLRGSPLSGSMPLQHAPRRSAQQQHALLRQAWPQLRQRLIEARRQHPQRCTLSASGRQQHPPPQHSQQHVATARTRQGAPVRAPVP